MVVVHPSRDVVSDRFPVASFVVNAPPDRLFEVACATDPALFSPAYKGRRTESNFYTSRIEGLLRAPAGQSTWLVPSEQLRRFAGAGRLYYAVAHYGGARGEDPRLSIALQDPGSAPYIRLAADFSGRTLDRTRLGGVATADNRYGRRASDLSWGGDLLSVPTRYGEAGPPAYDDGFPGAPWNLPQDGEPPGVEDARGLAPRLALPLQPPAPSPAYGGRVVTATEPRGTEHGPRRIGSAGGRVPPMQPADNPFKRARYAGDSDSPGVPLTLAEKLRIVEVVGRNATRGQKYTFTDTSDGLAWGLVAFRQATGGLGAALTQCSRRDAEVFARVFGPDSAALLQTTTSESVSGRMAAVGEPLTSAAWLARFREAGAVDAFKFAQNQAAVESLLDPMIPICFEVGVGTDRGLAMALDTASALGVPAAIEAVRAAADPNGGTLDRLVSLAAGSPWSARLSSLRSTGDLHDTIYGRV